MGKLNEKAVLVNVNIKKFANKVENKKESRALRARHNISDESGGKAHYEIFNPKDIAHIVTPFSKARNILYGLTKPFDRSGNHILPIGKMDKFKKEISELDAKGRNKAIKFAEEDLDRIKGERKLEINGMYEEEKFPSKEKFIDSYGIMVTFNSIPNEKTIWDDESLSDKTKDELIKSLSFNKTTILKELLLGNEESVSRKDSPKDLVGVLEKFIRTMEKEKPHFKEATVAAVREFHNVIREFNISDDEGLEEIAISIEERFEDLNANTLRDSKEVRDDAIIEANEMIDEAKDTFKKANEETNKLLENLEGY